MHGQIGQNLTVHFDASQVQAVDKTRVCQCLIMRTHGCVDPLDPQRTEVALAVLAVTGCVLVRLVDGLARDLEGILAAAVIAFRGFDDFLVTGVSCGSTFNAGRIGISS